MFDNNFRREITKGPRRWPNKLRAHSDAQSYRARPPLAEEANAPHQGKAVTLSEEAAARTDRCWRGQDRGPPRRPKCTPPKTAVSFRRERTMSRVAGLGTT